MKKLSYSAIVFLALACNQEADVDPASGTFLRYFGSEKNHTAVLALEADNGVTMLSNVEVQEGTTIGYKIKMIHADLNGNMLWEKSYPAYRAGDTPEDNTFFAHSFAATSDGYLVIGDRINSTEGTTELLLLQINSHGDSIGFKRLSGQDLDEDPTLYAGASLSGRAVLEITDGGGQHFLLLGTIKNATNGADMFVASINPKDFSVEWTREYGSAENSLINRLFLLNDGKLFWGSSVTNSGQQDIRFVKVGTDSQLPLFGDPLPSDESETATDLCKAPGGYAITGSINDGTSDDDIFLMKIKNDATLDYIVRFSTTENTPENKQVDFSLNDKGNSVCTGVEGGLVVLATVETPDSQQDLYVFKVSETSKEIMWANSFGGMDREEGASIRPLKDGSGYLVFGTSYFGRVKKLTLMKLDRDGML